MIIHKVIRWKILLVNEILLRAIISIVWWKQNKTEQKSLNDLWKWNGRPQVHAEEKKNTEASLPTRRRKGGWQNEKKVREK